MTKALTVDEALRYLRLSISVTDVEKQAALNTLAAALQSSPDIVELLPCPFCGGEAGYYPSGEAVFKANWIGHVCHCKDCQARVSTAIGKDSAVLLWNRRASQPATPTGGEATKEAQKRYPDDADDYGHPESLKHLRDAFMAGASFEKETSARSSAGSDEAATAPCPGCDGHECIRDGKYDCQYPPKNGTACK